jgi:hypothetical protein
MSIPIILDIHHSSFKNFLLVHKVTIILKPRSMKFARVSVQAGCYPIHAAKKEPYELSGYFSGKDDGKGV